MALLFRRIESMAKTPTIDNAFTSAERCSRERKLEDTVWWVDRALGLSHAKYASGPEVEAVEQRARDVIAGAQRRCTDAYVKQYISLALKWEARGNQNNARIWSELALHAAESMGKPPLYVDAIRRFGERYCTPNP